MNESISSHDPVSSSAPEFGCVDVLSAEGSSRSSDSVVLALVGGSFAALLGAAIWTAVSIETGYQITVLALGVGLLVGFAVRFSGKGVTLRFGFFAAGLTLFGCLLGKLFAEVAYVAAAYEVGFWEVATRLNGAMIAEIYRLSFSFSDPLFYAIAAYASFRFGVCEAN